MAAGHLITGRAGEELAAAFLVEKGLAVVERNFRCPGGEIDLICRDRGTLVFVEVKTRSGDVRGEPGEAVGRAKRRHIRRTAYQYLRELGHPAVVYRYDIVEILLEVIAFA